MAIFSNLTELAGGTHGIFESSLLKSSISGHLWDCLVVTETSSGGNITRTPIDVDNAVAVKVGDFTHKDKGLQERYATIAGVKDKVGIVGSPALIKDARSQYEASEGFFYNKAGQDSKVYEVVGDKYDGDIFGVSLNMFTTASQTNVTEDAYVVLDGTGKYVAQAAAPTMANYGFVGRVHSIYTNNDYTLVRIYVIQNVDNNN